MIRFQKSFQQPTFEVAGATRVKKLEAQNFQVACPAT